MRFYWEQQSSNILPLLRSPQPCQGLEHLRRHIRFQGIPSINTVVCVSLRRQFWRCLNSYFPLRNDCLHYFINTPYEKTEYALQKYRSWYIGNHNSGQQKLYQEREFFAKIFRVSRHWALVFCWYLSNYQKLVPWYESLNICFNEPLSLFWL